MKKLITALKVIAGLTMWSIVGFITYHLAVFAYRDQAFALDAMVHTTVVAYAALVGTLLLMGVQGTTPRKKKQKTPKLQVAAVALLALSLPAAVQATDKLVVKCPFGSEFTSWTGQTQFINGQNWYVMKCISGHVSLSKSL